MSSEPPSGRRSFGVRPTARPLRRCGLARRARVPRPRLVPSGRSGDRRPPIGWLRIPSSMAVRARPEAGAPTVGTMPSGFEVLRRPDHRLGGGDREGRPMGPRRDPLRVASPGRLDPAARAGAVHTFVEVHVDLSRHWVSVSKFGRVLFGLRAATGAASSPTPVGEYFVTDRIPFSAGGSLGTFAFGISGIQPRLPAGLERRQPARDPRHERPVLDRNRRASAGCVRVTERGAGPADVAAAPRHAGHRRALRLRATATLQRPWRSTNAFRSFRWASA